MVPFSVTTALTRPPCVLQPARGAALMDGHAVLACGGRERRHGHRRLGAPVARRVQAADPFLGIAGQALGDLGRRQDGRVDLHLARRCGPSLPAGQLVLALGQEQHAGAAEAGIDTGVVLHVLPQPQRLAGQRNLLTRTALLAAPAPIAARLLAADMALLDQRDGETLLRQMIGRRHADDAAADDDDVHLRRQAFVAVYTGERRGHEDTPAIQFDRSKSLVAFVMGCSFADRARRAGRHRGN